MKKLVLLLSILIYLFIPSNALAHMTESDGDIRITTHFDPDDDPIVGEQTGFYFAFKDKTNRFKPADCDCVFSVLKDGKELYSQPLLRDNPNPSLNNVSVVYTFPERSVYQVKVTGKPLAINAFQPFDITFDIRVERTSKSQRANPQEDGDTSWFDKYFSHSGHVMLALALFAGFVVFAVIQKTRESKKSNLKGGDNK